MAAKLDPAATAKRAKEIETEYLSSLADLNVNSKPLINMLTILAEENLEYAEVIVSAVEKHLAQVQPDVKLPILYLVDSIVKNVGKQYQSLFSQVIVGMFCGVFETVNERIREKMFSLRQTWNDVFPQSKLCALDIKTHSIDPGWPITAQIPKAKPAIHVNPMFLQNNQVAEPNSDMQAQLRDKQLELLELQARKLKLELLATKKQIEEQEKQLHLQTAGVSKDNTAEVKRPISTATSVPHAGTVPPPRGRILPPNPAMLNLIRSRDPRLARQQAQLTAQMVAASTNSTPTMVAGVAIPPQPTALDPSGKPLSIKERLGRIPKRVDPRIKTQSTVENDRKKPSSTATSTIVTSTPIKSRNEHDINKRRERKEETSPKSGKTSSSKSTSSDKKRSSSSLSPPKSSSPSKKKSSTSSDKSPLRSEKGSSKQRESSRSSKTSKSASRRAHDSSKSSENSSLSPISSSENLMPVINDSKDIDLRMLLPEKKIKLDTPAVQQPAAPPPVQLPQVLQQQPQQVVQKQPQVQQQPQQQQNLQEQPPPPEKVVSKPLAEQSKSEYNLPPLSTLRFSIQRISTTMLSLLVFEIPAIWCVYFAIIGSIVLPQQVFQAFQRLSEKTPPKGAHYINSRCCLYESQTSPTVSVHKTSRALNYLICCQINAVLISEIPRGNLDQPVVFLSSF